MSPEDLTRLMAETMPRLVRIMTLLAIGLVLNVALLGASIYMGMSKRPQVLGITESGRVIPIVPLDKPYVSDSRVLSFADECTRTAFSHDFVNFRSTMAQASNCFTSNGVEGFSQALGPLLQDLEARRMVMSVSLQAPAVVRTFKRNGQIYSWLVQTRMTLNREGTRERVSPTTYVVDLVIERVPLEESIRGISVAQINVRPGGAS